MKKEIPRLLKCASILYAFDSGTIFNVVPVFKYFKKSSVNFNPDELGIRWIMIVPDTKFSVLKNKYRCISNGVHPSQIIKCSTCNQKTKHPDSLIKLLSDIHDHKNIVNYVSPEKIKKVIYVNNDISIDDKINQSISRCNYNIVAMNIMDLWQQRYVNML